MAACSQAATLIFDDGDIIECLREAKDSYFHKRKALIVAQRNLSLPNIPYIEEEEIADKVFTELIEKDNDYPTSHPAYGKGWRGVSKAKFTDIFNMGLAQSKGGYSEVDEVENVIKELTNKYSLNGWEQNGVRIGYKAAQSKGGYSEADLRKAIEMARELDLNTLNHPEDGYTYTHIEDDIIASLNQPKDIEIETYCTYGDDCPSKGAYILQHLCDIQPVTYQKEVGGVLKTFLKVKQ